MATAISDLHELIRNPLHSHRRVCTVLAPALSKHPVPSLLSIVGDCCNVKVD